MIKGMKVWQSKLMFCLAGWVNQEHLKVIDYLQDENQTLRKLIKKQRIRLSLEDRRRLEVKGRAIGRKKLEEVATIACADTTLGWPNPKRIQASTDDGAKVDLRAVPFGSRQPRFAPGWR